MHLIMYKYLSMSNSFNQNIYLFYIRFDFTAPYYHVGRDEEKSNVSQNIHSVQVEKDGKLHCILLWWTLSLDDDGELLLSMVPRISKNDKTDIVVSFFCMHTIDQSIPQFSASIGDQLEYDGNQGASGSDYKTAKIKL